MVTILSAIASIFEFRVRSRASLELEWNGGRTRSSRFKEPIEFTERQSWERGSNATSSISRSQRAESELGMDP
jgi:hypothetical protein